jgi:uncharacterized membrane protein affecting hemolysin expression
MPVLQLSHIARDSNHNNRVKRTQRIKSTSLLLSLVDGVLNVREGAKAWRGRRENTAHNQIKTLNESSNGL